VKLRDRGFKEIGILSASRGCGSIQTMKETMTYAEISSQFDSEWVLLENPHTGPDLNVETGKVLWHSKSRDEVYRKARELRPAHSAVLYVGRMPDDVAVVL